MMLKNNIIERDNCKVSYYKNQKINTNLSQYF